MGLSILDRYAKSTDSERIALLDALDGDVLDAIASRDWSVIARPEQQAPPGDWMIWLIITGRGWGKSIAAAHWCFDRVKSMSAGGVSPVRWALVAPTYADGRDTMVEGETGMLSVIPPSMLTNGSVDDSWNRSIGELVLEGGHKFRVYSSEKARSLRGPQHHGAWIDELAALKDAKNGPTQDTTWSNLMLGMRLPPDPRIVVTTTPRPNALIETLLHDAIIQAEACLADGGYWIDDLAGRKWMTEPRIVLTRGTTYDNINNLAPAFRDQVMAMYEGTTLGRQELHGEIVAMSGGMFSRDRVGIIEQSTGSGRRIRVWDLAATAVTERSPDPDWTVGTLLAFDPGGPYRWVVEHVVRFRGSPGRVEEAVTRTALMDGKKVPILIEQEPGSAGKLLLSHYGRLLEPYTLRGYRPSGDKAARAQPVAGAVERGDFWIVDGPWLNNVLDEMSAFPAGPHDDFVDTLSAGFDILASVRSGRSAVKPAGDTQIPGWRV